MSTIKHYVANAHGEFDPALLDVVEAGFAKAKDYAEATIKADKIDVVFVNAPIHTIPELGLGGNSPGPYNVYVSLNPEYKDLLDEDVASTLVHEFHHNMRWRRPGYGTTLGQALVSEGLACLYEEEYSGKVPIYAEVNLSPEQITRAQTLFDSKAYSHAEWFFGAEGIERWFGYTYGYQLAKNYSKKVGKTAAELVAVSANLLLEQ